MTLTMSAPAATANVSASWKLMPHSAWPAAMSVSGAASPYGRIWRSIAGVAVPALRAGRRRTRCGRCSASSRGRGGPCRGAGESGVGEAAAGRRPRRDRRRCRPSRGATAGDESDGLAVAPRRAGAATSERDGDREDGAHGRRMTSTWIGTSASRRDAAPGIPGRRRVEVGLLPSLVRARSGSAGLWPSHTLSASALPGGVVRLGRV